VGTNSHSYRMTLKIHLGLIFGGVLFLYSGCHFGLIPILPSNPHFKFERQNVEPPRRLSYDERAQFRAKEVLRNSKIPRNTPVLLKALDKGDWRVDLFVQHAALELLTDRECKRAIPILKKMLGMGSRFDLLGHYSLCKVDPKQFPVHSLLDSLHSGRYDKLDAVAVAGYMATLKDPSQFHIIRNAILEGNAQQRQSAVQWLWYFWPYQNDSLGGQRPIDLFPLLKVVLYDSSRFVQDAAFQQYRFAPRHPGLKNDLEELLAASQIEYEKYSAKSILVYRYHRKEKGFPREMGSYWSRKKRTYRE
jgi:hypothetical protein